jgi:hypothetical protein
MLRRVSASTAIAAAVAGSATRHAHKTFDELTYEASSPVSSVEFDNARFRMKIQKQKFATKSVEAAYKQRIGEVYDADSFNCGNSTIATKATGKR